MVYSGIGVTAALMSTSLLARERHLVFQLANLAWTLNHKLEIITASTFMQDGEAEIFPYIRCFTNSQKLQNFFFGFNSSIRGEENF